MTDPEDRFEDWLTRHQVEPLPPRPGAYERVARSARRRRAGRAMVAAVALSVALAAAAGSIYRLAIVLGPVSTPAATSTASEPTTTPPSPDTPSQPPSSDPSASARATNDPAQSSRCHTDEVRVTHQAAPGGGAMGGVYEWLIFTNTSTRTCTLYGFPGVSYLTGPSGQQVNEPARRNNSVTPHRVTLAPGQGAHAQVRTGHPQAYPDTCKPVAVAGYRVYLPDETTPVFVPAPTQQCSTIGVNSMLVDPIAPGVTE
jgi:hypothetical protein